MIKKKVRNRKLIVTHEAEKTYMNHLHVRLNCAMNAFIYHNILSPKRNWNQPCTIHKSLILAERHEPRHRHNSSTCHELPGNLTHGKNHQGQTLPMAVRHLMGNESKKSWVPERMGELSKPTICSINFYNKCIHRIFSRSE